MIGVMYTSGKGVTEDDKEAARWYRKAAEQGNVQAQLFTGMTYALGKGIPQNFEKATCWFHKAAEQGNADGERFFNKFKKFVNKPEGIKSPQ